MQAYGYKFSDYFMEYGPVLATSPEEARLLIRRRLGVPRLPRGLKIWDLETRPLARWCARSA